MPSKLPKIPSSPPTKPLYKYRTLSLAEISHENNILRGELREMISRVEYLEAEVEELKRKNKLEENI